MKISPKSKLHEANEDLKSVKTKKAIKPLQGYVVTNDTQDGLKYLRGLVLDVQPLEKGEKMQVGVVIEESNSKINHKIRSVMQQRIL